ncbi:MAG TPA: transcriptional repressor [bacterium]|nr:transcriptional repressor [bacterium]
MTAIKTKTSRMTRQKRIILEEISQLKSHPSASEVYEAVKKRLPKISMGTVYRNLQRLSSCGEIRALSPVGSSKRFDDNPDDHYHVRCMCCGRLVDVCLDSLDDMEESVSDTTQFMVEGHFLEFYGVCPCCRQAEPSQRPHRKRAKASSGATS